jgi:hypothetical protein
LTAEAETSQACGFGVGSFANANISIFSTSDVHDFDASAPSRMASNFGDMPQELYIEILANLDAVSLIRCAMVRQCVPLALG